jgi:hypothetical protein
MAERMPKLIYAEKDEEIGNLVHLCFEHTISAKHLAELEEFVKLKFAGQLRRDPDAPQTAPPPPEASS